MFYSIVKPLFECKVCVGCCYGLVMFGVAGEFNSVVDVDSFTLMHSRIPFCVSSTEFDQLSSGLVF